MARGEAFFCCFVVWIACCMTSLAEQQSSVAAQQFQKKLYDQIGDAWYRDMQANSKKVALGTVRIAFTTSPDGKITRLRVISNTSNEFFASICIRAIRQAKIPPVPAELLAHGRFEDQISFKNFPN